MRPDVALAFDRLDAAAKVDGVDLIIDSAYRSNAEQAVLWAQHPDPKWVAPPGTSLHRLGTELDLGPRSAYPWLAANAPRFHFVLRYSCLCGPLSVDSASGLTGGTFDTTRTAGTVSGR